MMILFTTSIIACVRMGGGRVRGEGSAGGGKTICLCRHTYTAWTSSVKTVYYSGRAVMVLYHVCLSPAIRSSPVRRPGIPGSNIPVQIIKWSTGVLSTCPPPRLVQAMSA